MSPTVTSRRAALAAALVCAATVAPAQGLPPAQGIFTLVSPALPMSNEFRCTVTNVSALPVTLSLLQIVDNGVAQANVNAACTGTLAAGDRCTVRTAVHPYRGSVVPHCRARFSGTQEAALVGSLRSSHVSNGDTHDLAVVPLQLLKGVTLSLTQQGLP